MFNSSPSWIASAALYLNIIILTTIISSCYNELNTEPITDLNGYELVWSDEFDSDGAPSPKNWRYEYGFIRNQELQYYKSTNAICDSGFLIIEAKRDSIPNPIYEPGSQKWKEQREYAQYSSASLYTLGRHSWMFGRFEMRAKIDIGKGLWPAFWTQGVKGGWPYNGEVDIMEYYKGNILANIAWGSSQNGKAIWNSFRKPVSDLGGEEWAKEFHVWRMEWDSLQIQLYLDDMLLNSVDLSETCNQDAEGKNPFLQPLYIIINLAVGGVSGDPSSTTFPAYYLIDYIRVYQKL